MKKIILLIIIATSIIGCSKENEDNTKTIDDLIIGVWSPIRFVYEESGEIVYDRIPTECQLKSRQTYYENGSCSDLIFSGTTSTNCNSGLYEGTYSLNGGLLVKSEFGNNFIVEIIENNLILKWSACDSDCDKWNIHYYKKVTE
jgi:hypothetical protein